MNDPWLDFIIRIQAIAQAGLAYGKDRYDLERYTQLRQIAAEMLAARTSLPKERIGDLFLNESGYQTPKVDTRGAVFLDGKILLARENNGAWALPGGWCDVDLSVAANTEKEVLEGVTYANAMLQIEMVSPSGTVSLVKPIYSNWGYPNVLNLNPKYKDDEEEDDDDSDITNLQLSTSTFYLEEFKDDPKHPFTIRFKTVCNVDLKSLNNNINITVYGRK